jgi:hypothetical protein
MAWNFLNKGHLIYELGFTDKWLYNRLTKKGLPKKTYSNKKGDFSYKYHHYLIYFDATNMQIQLMKSYNSSCRLDSYLPFGVIHLHQQKPIASIAMIDAPQCHEFVRWIMDDTIVMGKNAGKFCK